MARACLLEPLLLPKVWGGRALQRWGLDLPPGERIGEAWLAADLRETAAGGAGGAAMQSPLADVQDGVRTLRDCIACEPDAWLGRVPGDGFPLLVKLLDAAEHLSVQVHPTPTYAAAHPGARVKHECWHVLAAEPGASLYLGVVSGTTRDAFAEAVRADRVTDLLERVPAVAGDCWLLPSGLVHALGAGVVVAEVQTPSDTTYRLYDWTREYARAPRALHLDEGLAAADLTLRPVCRRAYPDAVGVIAESDAFVVRLARSEVAGTLEVLPGDGPLVVVPLRGDCTVSCGATEFRARTGHAVAVPASSRVGVVVRWETAAEVLLAEAKPPLVAARP